MLRWVYWSLFSTLGLVGMMIIIWLSISTVNILNVMSYTYDESTRTFTLVRRVNWPTDVVAAWRTEAFGNGMQCGENGLNTYEKYVTDSMGRVVSGPDGRPMELLEVRYLASRELMACMTDPDVSVISQWSVRVLGPIFLRPTYRYIPSREVLG